MSPLAPPKRDWLTAAQLTLIGLAVVTFWLAVLWLLVAM